MSCCGRGSTHRLPILFDPNGRTAPAPPFFARILEYKQRWHSGSVIFANRWFASTRNCSRCGQHNPHLTLRDRIFACLDQEGCGLRIDRDLNAAVNLATWAESHQNSGGMSGSGSAKRAPRSSKSVDGKALAHTLTRVSETSPDEAETPMLTP